MAQRDRERYRLCRIALVMALLVFIAVPERRYRRSPTSSNGRTEPTSVADISKWRLQGRPRPRRRITSSHRNFGDRDQRTLTSLTSIGFLYDAQGRYGEAEPLFKEALQGSREVLGPRHRDTLTTQLNMVALLVNQSRRQEAVRMLHEMEPNLLGWIGQASAAQYPDRIAAPR